MTDSATDEIWTDLFLMGDASYIADLAPLGKHEDGLTPSDGNEVEPRPSIGADATSVLNGRNKPGALGPPPYANDIICAKVHSA